MIIISQQSSSQARAAPTGICRWYRQPLPAESGLRKRHCKCESIAGVQVLTAVVQDTRLDVDLVQDSQRVVRRSFSLICPFPRSSLPGHGCGYLASGLSTAPRNCPAVPKGYSSSSVGLVTDCDFQRCRGRARSRCSERFVGLQAPTSLARIIGTLGCLARELCALGMGGREPLTRTCQSAGFGSGSDRLVGVPSADRRERPSASRLGASSTPVLRPVGRTVDELHDRFSRGVPTLCLGRSPFAPTPTCSALHTPCTD